MHRSSLLFSLALVACGGDADLEARVAALEAQSAEAGRACWDLDGDGEAGDGEDVNGDGRVDVADCRGAGGVACWDLDMDGEADPSEDRDGSGTVDVGDCVATLDEMLADPAFSAAVRDVLDEMGGVSERLTDLEDRLPAGLTAVGMITQDTILAVPADYPTVMDALAWLDDKRIARSATVTLQIAPGTYAMTETLDVAHPDGARLRIVGDPNDATAVVLTFPQGVEGVRVGDAHALGGLDGMTLQGAGGTFVVNGVDVEMSASATIGPALIVQGFGGAGVRSGFGASLVADGVLSTGNRRGFVATRHAMLSANEAQAVANTQDGVLVDWSSSFVSNGGRADDNGGAGVVASAGGSASLINFAASGNVNGGVMADRNGHIFARAAVLDTNGEGVVAAQSGTVDGLNATITASVGDGVRVEDGAHADVGRATITNNGGWGLTSTASGLLEQGGATVSGNGLGDADPAVGPVPDGEIY